MNIYFVPADNRKNDSQCNISSMFVTFYPCDCDGSLCFLSVVFFHWWIGRISSDWFNPSMVETPLIQVERERCEAVAEADQMQHTKHPHWSPKKGNFGTNAYYWLVVWTILFFSIYWDFIIPVDELIFFRGVGLNHQAVITSLAATNALIFLPRALAAET